MSTAAKPLKVAVGIVGATGLIGSTLVKQITAQGHGLVDTLKATISVVGITSSKKMLVDASGFQAGTWREQLAEKGQDLDLTAFALQVCQAAAQPAGCAVLVDCTASDEVPALYADFMRLGMHLVTPNKKFGAGPLQRFRELQQLQREHNRHFLAEASVGAGLPVLTTLKSLIETGDQVIKVEGILSGTLSYIFNTYKPGMKFSDVVSDANAKGYTEPDPREDLSGMDVARKVIILARECGLPVEMEQLSVSSLVPKALEGCSVEEYMQRLPEHDGEIASRAEAAHAAGEVIRYVGSVDVAQGTASVSLVSFPQSHAFAQLSGSDNMIVFTTERYKERPLVVRGPGAGAEVTAAGVFSDIIQVARCHKAQ